MAMQYIVISATEIDELIKEVNDNIQQGWEPIGGVAIDSSSSNGKTSKYFQSLVKKQV